MYIVLIIVSVLILLSVFTTKALYRFGVPSLLIFLGLGMLMGSDGIGGIRFDNFEMAENFSIFAIVIIIFFGGFGTKWETAKPTAVKSILLSSVGTIITATVTGLFCALILKVPVLYGLLFGAVVASTDAASVFSILRSRKLNLKDGLAPLLEIESGSNDPFAYLMTIIIIMVIQSGGTDAIAGKVIASFVMQIGIAAIVGVSVSTLAVILLRNLNLEIDGLYPILLLAIVMLSFSLCEVVGGNGLLCVYILGIVIGNSKILNRKMLVHFFDGLAWIMQIMLFFFLGLLSLPSSLPSIFIPGILLSVIIIFVARPISVFGILSWFKVPVKSQILTSWVGLRGAASIVFAVTAVIALGDDLPYDLFHLVFFVALFSILIQGTLTPFMAKKLDLVDKDEKNTVMKTFTDYFGESHNALFEHKITKKDKFMGKSIVDSDIPESILIIMIKRGNEIITPKGSTKLMENDVLVVSGEDFSFFDE